jgi:hypothetical protein
LKHCGRAAIQLSRLRRSGVAAAVEVSHSSEQKTRRVKRLNRGILMAFRGCFGKDKEISSKLRHLPKLFLRINIIEALSATYALQYFTIISLTAPFDNNVSG